MTQAIEYRWIGSSAQTLRQLLDAVLRLGKDAYRDQETLERAVYHLYESNGHATPSPYNTSEEVDNDIRTVKIPDGVKRSRQDAETSFFHYTPDEVQQNGRRKRRVSIHAHPVAAVTLVQQLVDTFGNHPSVYDIKIAGTLDGITTRLDTIIVYCYEDEYQVVNKVVAFLREQERCLLPGSPAMMAPTGVQGVATADQSAGGSWGSTRTSQIAFRAWTLYSGGQLTIENLVGTVTGAFKSAGIDPDNPAEYLSKS